MDYSKGYKASFYATIVDPASWRDLRKIRILDGSASYTDEGLRGSADITCREGEIEKAQEHYIRVWMDIRQGGSAEHVPLFTGLASAPETTIGSAVNEMPLECYSVLKPVEDAGLERGWYAPAGKSGAEIVGELLSTTPAPVVVREDSPVLLNYILAEDDENSLTMIDKILTAIGWRLRLTGDGTVEVCSKAESAVATFGSGYDVIAPPITVTEDWFNCPNVFRANANGMSAIARDDSEDSAFSTVNRGREVSREESDCDLGDNESLEEYAERRLREEQIVAKPMKYKRCYDPRVAVSDLIRIHYPKHGVQGLFYVSSQDIEFKPGANTSEGASAWI